MSRGLCCIEHELMGCSHGQSHRSVSEEHRNHESHESACQATSAQRDHAGNEYGNDEGTSPSHYHSFTPCSPSLTFNVQSGIMEEMMEETLDSVDADDELEEEADAEVDKVLFELTDGKLGQAGKVGSALPVRHPLSCINRNARPGTRVSY